MIRQATLDDREQLVYIAKESAKLFPWLNADKTKIFQLATESISSKAHYCGVADDGEVRGCLVALTTENLWAERKGSHVVMWRSVKPGCSIALLRDYRRWLDTRPGVRFGSLEFSLDYTPRMGVLLDRVGFKRHGGAYIYTG